MTLYVLRNRLTGHEYVGATTQSLLRRWNDHRARVWGRSSPLYLSMRLHGCSAFEMVVLDTAQTYEELLEKEQRAIRERRTQHPYGYNLVAGGPSNAGWHMRVETRDKIAAKATGRPISDETRRKMSLKRRGRPFSEAHKRAISMSQHRANTPEKRARLSANKRQWWATRTPEQRRQHVELMAAGHSPSSQ